MFAVAAAAPDYQNGRGQEVDPLHTFTHFVCFSNLPGYECFGGKNNLLFAFRSVDGSSPGCSGIPHVLKSLGTLTLPRSPGCYGIPHVHVWSGVVLFLC